MSALSSAGETGLLVAFPQSEAGNLNSVLLVTEEGVADFHLLMNARLVALSTIKDQPTKFSLLRQFQLTRVIQDVMRGTLMLKDMEKR